MGAAEDVDPQRSVEQRRPRDAWRRREKQATEEPVEVADGDAEVGEHDIAEHDGRGQRSFEPFAAGDVLDHPGAVPLTAPHDGVLMFPKVPELWKIGAPIGFTPPAIDGGQDPHQAGEDRAPRRDRFTADLAAFLRLLPGLA